MMKFTAKYGFRMFIGSPSPFDDVIAVDAPDVDVPPAVGYMIDGVDADVPSRIVPIAIPVWWV